MRKFKAAGAAVIAAVIASFGTSAWAAEHALTADVVVVGGGAAGMAASVRAAERGAKVILLEKNQMLGGGASYAEGLFGAATRWQRAKNYGFPVTGAAKYLQRFHHYLSDAKMNRTYLEGSALVLDWLAQHDIRFEAIQVSPAETLTWHVIGKYKNLEHGAAYIEALKDHADKLGVKTMLATPAKDLVMKDGKVTGVVAADAKGDTYRIASKAVILATGGFGDSPELRARYLGVKPENVKPSVPLLKTGDGITMGLKVGADETSKTAVMHPGTEGKGIDFLGNIYVMTWQPANLWVNSRGERFAPETLSFEFALAGNAIRSQHGNYGWTIFDEKSIEYAEKEGADVGIGVIIPTLTKLTNLKKELDAAIAAGSESVKSAGSAAELARQIGVPAEALEKTIERYNGFAKTGSDTDFFKEELWLRPIEGKRLYAVKIRPYFFTTCGGLRADTDMSVLDKADKPIPGLYVAGVDAGGLYGDTYTTWTSGHAFGFAAWSGYTAANSATEGLGK